MLRWAHGALAECSVSEVKDEQKELELELESHRPLDESNRIESPLSYSTASNNNFLLRDIDTHTRRIVGTQTLEWIARRGMGRE
jgi:hypothetical protein